MPKVTVNGIRMFYEETGGGEPLILIMGFGGDHLAWAFQVRALAEHYRVVTFDNRGAGQSDAPEPPYTIRTMADDTAGVFTPPGVAPAAPPPPSPRAPHPPPPAPPPPPAAARP